MSVGVEEYASGSLLVHDSSTGHLLSSVYAHDHSVMSLNFSADESLLVTDMLDKTVKVWNVSNCEYVQIIDGHTEGVNHVCFISDRNDCIVSASDDQTVKVWRC